MRYSKVLSFLFDLLIVIFHGTLPIRKRSADLLDCGGGQKILGSIADPQQFLPLAKVALEPHAFGNPER
jgi:hypothetical protein